MFTTRAGAPCGGGGMRVHAGVCVGIACTQGLPCVRVHRAAACGRERACTHGAPPTHAAASPGSQAGKQPVSPWQRRYRRKKLEGMSGEQGRTVQAGASGALLLWWLQLIGAVLINCPVQPQPSRFNQSSSKRQGNANSPL